MTRNSTATAAVEPLAEPPPGPPWHRSVVLVGLMGAGKTAIGRRLALRLGLPFRDADAEIEQAAGETIAGIFARHGEPAFREGEARVIRRLLGDTPLVLATGGGAFVDPRTREAVRASGAVSAWLRVPLPTLVRRVAHRTHRPLLAGADPEAVLRRLQSERGPIYAEADVIVDCTDESPENTTTRVLDALLAWREPRRLTVDLGSRAYEIVAGDGLVARAGALAAPVLPQKRAVVITDTTVAALHLPALLAGFAETGVETRTVTIDAGERSKTLATYGRLAEDILAGGIERRTAIVALGGGVVGDLAGFVAATLLRGLPFVQVPTTLLAQVDSSVGGKTGVNAPSGKNLIGAFHQPRLVIADTATLATLPPRELRAGYAEIVKAGLIGDAPFYAWCETHGASVVGGQRDAQEEAILRACAFKAMVVGDDEREERPSGGRALLNLGHTFGHALEAELGYGTLLHGEAVALGLGLAFRLSAKLGHCEAGEAERVIAHVRSVGLPAELSALDRPISAQRLIAAMRRDKKARDGRMTFVLARGVGAAFTDETVPVEAVEAVLRENGCAA